MDCLGVKVGFQDIFPTKRTTLLIIPILPYLYVNNVSLQVRLEILDGSQQKSSDENWISARERPSFNR